jgi:hypothetical protein
MRKSTESDDLRRRVDELTSLLMNQKQAPEAGPPKKARSPAQKAWAKELATRAKARAAEKAAV